MILAVLKAMRVIVPIAVFMATVSIGDALGIKSGSDDYTLSWHAYVADVYWVGFVVFPVGSWLVAKSIYDLTRAMDSTRWLVARGKIITSEVEETVAYGGAPLFRPKVRYQYTIAGRDYENDAIRISRTNFFTIEPAAKIVVRYPAGADVEVRCDPADPSEAVLEASGDSARRNICIGLLLLSAPFVIGAEVVWLNSLS